MKDNKKRITNPLIKRVPKELLGEWRKFLVIFLFLSLTIGFVSGMFVANDSMLTANEEGKVKYKLEDGNFELKKEAKDELITAIESGEKIDLRQYYIDEAHDKIDEKVDKEAKKSLKKEVRKTLEEKITEEITKAVEAGVEAKLAAASFMVKPSDEEIQKMKDEAVEKALDEKLEKTVDENYKKAYKKALKSDDFKEEIEKAKDKAYKKAEKKINKKFDKQEDKKSKEEKEKEKNFKVTEVTVYPFYFKDVEEDIKGDGKKVGKVRIYAKNDEINKACLMKGHLPKEDDEIAIDRMHADNNKIKVGDTIKVADLDYKVCGLIAYVNYSTLYENNTDMMFDALNFDVAMVTKEGWDRADGKIRYTYSWKYKDSFKNSDEESKLSDNFLQALVSQTVKGKNELQDYIPRYGNNAVIFAPDDMSGDKTMGSYLLYILVAVLAFIFALTISSTIQKEASVIGTLRASGYTKSELVAHYMSMPVLVTLFAAIVGNVLGYSCFKKIIVAMYYNSYSLPTYETIWNSEAFIKTTLVPVIIMIVVNYLVVRTMLRFSPLRFLRHDLKTTKRKKAMRLPRFKFLNRFRLRIMLQNLPNYLILLVGIYFVLFMLTFAFGLPTTLKHYQKNAVKEMFAKYQYILKDTEDDDENLITTSAEGAEKFATQGLVTTECKKEGETVQVYGVIEDSHYIDLSDTKFVEDDEVLISSAYADKFDFKKGDKVKLKKKYEGDIYTFKVKGIYDYMGGIAMFMPIDNYNSYFDNDEDYFTGYLTSEKVTDIDDKYIQASITEEDITKVSRQLDHSMGGYMNYFKVACIIFAAILIYLLTKVIIEKNENSISMVKILGYENKEIASLYLASTTIAVVLSTILTAYLAKISLIQLWYTMLMDMDGFLPAYVPFRSMVDMILMVIVAYLFIMLIDYRRIKKVPMDQALKNVE